MPETAWQRRVRRTLFLVGGASSVYFFFSYLAGRMRDARVRALKERRERETLKAHFTSLLSTISFTLYALLPNLEPQLFAAYPVEATSQALQAKASPQPEQPSTPPRPQPQSTHGTPARPTAAGPPVLQQDYADGETLQGLGSPTDTGTTASTPADSLILDGPPSVEGYSTEDASAVVVPQPPTHAPGTMADSVMSMATSTDYSDAGNNMPPESWASEFSRGSDEGDEMLTASTVSQSISLPPTDTSSAAPSPRSEMSRFDTSPSRSNDPEPINDPRTKKELWKDLKVQSLTRAFSTAYLVPLLYLLTSSQLSILSRTRYLQDVKESHAARELASPPPKKSTWFSYFSIENMGLSSYAEPVSTWMWGAPSQESASALSVREAELEQARGDAERLFLTYSWWLLHVGWKQLATRVEEAVSHVFGPLGLKRELSPETWAALVREIRTQVETDPDHLKPHQHGHGHGHGHGREHGHHHAHLFDFSTVLLPPSPLPYVDDCPLPQVPEGYLSTLIAQSAEHVSSPDARALIDRGVTAMLEDLGSNVNPPRRVADMLPELNRWSRSVWEGIPDGGVETLLALPEYEAFTALIFGDWAPR